MKSLIYLSIHLMDYNSREDTYYPNETFADSMLSLLSTTLTTVIMKLAVVSTIFSLCFFSCAQNVSSNGTIIYGVPQDTYNQLSKMAQIAMSTYADNLCAEPGGYPIVYTINNDTTDTYGWILRDDADKQLMLVFRGSETVLDFVEDSNYNQSSFEGEGINCDGCMVHQGYWQCWTSVRDEVIAQMQNQSSLNPGYGWIIIGHRFVPPSSPNETIHLWRQS